MRNLRHRYTYQQRLEFQNTIMVMRDYILPLLLARQNNACALCKAGHKSYDIDHLVYNPMVTINELRALCEACHYTQTDYRHLTPRQTPHNAHHAST